MPLKPASLLVAGLLGICRGTQLHRSALLRGQELEAPDFGLDESIWLGLEDDLSAEPSEPGALGLAGLIASRDATIDAACGSAGCHNADAHVLPKLPRLRMETPERQNVKPAATQAPESSVLAAKPTKAQAAQSYADDASHPAILILGQFNTGTNLLKKLLEMNFASIKRRGVEGQELDLWIWKHTKPELLKQQLQQLNKSAVLQDQGAYGIAVVRDPLSWVQSMKKAPYDLKYCMISKHWPTANCTFPKPFAAPSTISRSYHQLISHQRPFLVKNIESAWNEWNSQYDHLDLSVGFAPGKFLVVKYEDLVMHTNDVLAKIAKLTGRPLPAQVKQMHMAAKDHGKPNGHIEALRKIKEREYLKMYTRKERQEVCQRLDRDLMHLHGYGDCDGW